MQTLPLMPAGDLDLGAVSRLTDIGVGRSLEESVVRTERAIAKLEDGTYGTCDACGEAIPPARLSAMPDSVLCVTCAASERRGPPPRR
jgi:DnaK suppressor protein